MWLSACTINKQSTPETCGSCPQNTGTQVDGGHQLQCDGGCGSWQLSFKRDHASEALLKAPVSHPTPPHHSTSALPVKKRAAAVTSTTDNSRDSRKGQLPFNSCCKHAVVRRPFMYEVCKLKHLSKGHLPLTSCETAQKSRTFWSRSNTVEISCADLQAWLDTIFTRGLDRKLCVRWTKVWILYSTQQAARTQKAG